MNTDEIKKQLGPWLAKHRRSAWRPVVEDKDGPVAASKFSGTPWIGKDAEWPECTSCGKPLQHFLQLNLEALPPEHGTTHGTGLLQLFYCTRDECQGSGGWEPFDGINLARVVVPSGSAVSGTPEQEQPPYPPRQIVSWEKFEDLPSTAEHDQLGLEYSYDFKAHTVDLSCSELQARFEKVTDPYLAENIANSELGDKLGGWPHWIQNVEYPSCPKCSAIMTYVFQVDSENNIPFMFGDVGCGHIFQCPQHKEVVAFGWACS